MRTLVLYYSVTGNTRNVASALAKIMDAELCQIGCKAYSRGFLGPWRQAVDVLLGRSPTIEIPDQANQAWDLVIIGGPVWGARPAPPIRSYLARNADRYPQIALFVTCAGTSPKFPPSKAIAEMTALARRQPRGTHIFTQAQIESGALAAELAKFRNELGSDL